MPKTLYSQGHQFTAEELQSLKELHDSLVTSGDTDLAAELDLLKLGALSQSQATESKAQAKAALSQDSVIWTQREKQLREEGTWRTVRDVGLATFTISTVATLLLATINDRNSALLNHGSLNDFDTKNTFNNGMNWAMAGTASAAFVSCFRCCGRGPPVAESFSKALFRLSSESRGHGCWRRVGTAGCRSSDGRRRNQRRLLHPSNPTPRGHIRKCRRWRHVQRPSKPQDRASASTASGVVKCAILKNESG